MNWFKKSYICLAKFMFPEIDVIVEKFNKNQSILAKIDIMLEEEREAIERNLHFSEAINNFFFNKAPDMAWIKDLNGVYLKTNEAINTGLLCDCNPIGKNDIELATKAKLTFGEYNHTFGAKCANSDVIVREKVLNGTFNQLDGRFLESGKVRGKMLYLEVFKYPFYVNGKLVGVAGIGRDMTDYVLAYRDNQCSKCPSMNDIFKKYEFGEDM